MIFRRSYSWREGERLPSRLSGPVTVSIIFIDKKLRDKLDSVEDGRLQNLLES